MDGSAEGVARVQTPAFVDAAPERTAGVRGRIADAFAREQFVMLALAIDVLVLMIRFYNDVRSDTWLALVGGRLVWNDWVPHHDGLAVWTQGHTWIDQQWLGQLLFYWIHALGGLRLVLLVHVAVLVLAMGLALTYARRRGATPRAVAIVALFGIFVALPNSVARTQSFGYVLFVALFWLLGTSANTRSRRVLVALPLLMVWANVHGSAVLGAGLVVLWAAAQVIHAGVDRERDAWIARGRAVALAAAAPLCLLVSPYDLDLIGYYHDIIGSSAFRGLVTEWRPTTFPDQWPFFLLALPALWLVARKPRSLSLFEQLALVAMFLAGLDAIRYIVWFAFVAVLVVPRALDALWPVREQPIRRRMNIALSACAVALIALAFGSGAAHSRAWYEHGYPGGAARTVAAATEDDPSATVFANEAFADWLLWEVPALSGRVAFDARLELLSTQQLNVISEFRHQMALGAAVGYKLLVLDARDERDLIRAILDEPGAKLLYHNADVAVVSRGVRG
jgi:hypothetical protein